jgi:hypothetical protein
MLCTSPPTKRKRDVSDLYKEKEAAGVQFGQIMIDIQPAIAKVDQMFAMPIMSQCYIALRETVTPPRTLPLFRAVFGYISAPTFRFTSGRTIEEAARNLVEQLAAAPGDSVRTKQVKAKFLDDYIKLKLQTFLLVLHDAMENDDEDRLVDIDELMDELDTI